jgi:hypothetical protein
MKKDGRLEKFFELSKKNKIVKKVKCEICGIIFQQNHAHQRLCSLSCNAKKANIKRWGVKVLGIEEI